jgi:hypothetical protein
VNAGELVRCTECRHAEALRGSWCETAHRHAGGRYARRCAYHECLHPAPTLESLRGLPGVTEAEHREGRLWLRFHRHATSEQRDRVTELLTGRRPVLRRFALPCTERNRAPRQQAPRRGGNAA